MRICDVGSNESKVYNLLIPLQRFIIVHDFPKLKGLLDES